MKVRDRMTTDIITVGIDEPIRRVWDLVEEKRLRRFPVVRGGELVGIITDRDLRNAIASSVVLTEKKYHDFLLDTVKVESIMTQDPCTVTPETDLKAAARIILEMKIGGLPVLSGGKLVGIITETDLIETLVEMLPDD
ncbi:MAG: CBS domain-containing protein [Candidatus Geothermincolia bacterium]